MLKIRRPLGRLIFNMGIAIPGKTVFLIETAPRIFIPEELEDDNTNLSESKGINIRCEKKLVLIAVLVSKHLEALQQNTHVYKTFRSILIRLPQVLPICINELCQLG